MSCVCTLCVVYFVCVVCCLCVLCVVCVFVLFFLVFVEYLDKYFGECSKDSIDSLIKDRDGNQRRKFVLQERKLLYPQLRVTYNKCGNGNNKAH